MGRRRNRRRGDPQWRARKGRAIVQDARVQVQRQPTDGDAGVSATLARALAAHQAGRYAEAEAAYGERLAAAADDAVALHGLGLLRHQQGRGAEAAALIGRAIAAGLGGATPHANLAAVRLAGGDPAGAAAAAAAALALDPEHYGALLNLGLAAEAPGDWPRARAALERAAARRPGDATALDALLRVLDRAGDAPAALALRAARWRDRPGDAGLALEFGRACHREGRLAEALDALEAAVAPARPADEALLMHAVAALDLGEVALSMRSYDRLLASRPDYAEADSNRLIALQHDPAATPEALHAAHRAWARRHAPDSLEEPLPRPATDAPRRLAFVSPRLHEGPVATFLEPLLQALDRGRFELWFYSGSAHADAATARLRAMADGWCEAWRLDDAALCERLRADRIDVLFDLSGHAPAHRLRALARRAAPVQVCWLDYFCTTGVAALDWYYSDAGLSPEGGPQRYSERLLRLPAGRLCYAPPAGAPAVAPRGGGPLRFASFNRLSKLDDAVAAAWSRILAAAPGSVLRLRGFGLDDPRTRAFVQSRRFAPHGIGPERIEFEGYGTHAQAMAAWGEVDVALDPFPFSGCATTCDALWMGVPVVTRAGDTLVSRQSAALLQQAGLPELVATDWDDYVRRALALAGDAPRRARLRTELRERARGGFGDAARFARDFEHALLACWREAPARRAPA